MSRALAIVKAMLEAEDFDPRSYLLSAKIDFADYGFTPPDPASASRSWLYRYPKEPEQGEMYTLALRDDRPHQDRYIVSVYATRRGIRVYGTTHSPDFVEQNAAALVENFEAAVRLYGQVPEAVGRSFAESVRGLQRQYQPEARLQPQNEAVDVYAQMQRMAEQWFQKNAGKLRDWPYELGFGFYVDAQGKLVAGELVQGEEAEVQWPDPPPGMVEIGSLHTHVGSDAALSDFDMEEGQKAANQAGRTYIMYVVGPSQMDDGSWELNQEEFEPQVAEAADEPFDPRDYALAGRPMQLVRILPGIADRRRLYTGKVGVVVGEPNHYGMFPVEFPDGAVLRFSWHQAVEEAEEPFDARAYVMGSNSDEHALREWLTGHAAGIVNLWREQEDYYVSVTRDDGQRRYFGPFRRDQIKLFHDEWYSFRDTAWIGQIPESDEFDPASYLSTTPERIWDYLERHHFYALNNQSENREMWQKWTRQHFIEVKREGRMWVGKVYKLAKGGTGPMQVEYGKERIMRLLDRLPDLDTEPLKCPECGYTTLTGQDDEGLVDCMNCGIWFDPTHPANQQEALTEGRRKLGPTMKALKKGRIELTPQEKREVKAGRAVWDDGSLGVWKSVVKGKTWYVCHTHRAGTCKPTLRGAIRAFKWIKTTA